MKKCKYIERVFLDKYKCIDTIKELSYISIINDTNLVYFKVDRFNYKVIEKSLIIDSIIDL